MLRLSYIIGPTHCSDFCAFKSLALGSQVSKTHLWLEDANCKEQGLEDLITSHHPPNFPVNQVHTLEACSVQCLCTRSTIGPPCICDAVLAASQAIFQSLQHCRSFCKIARRKPFRSRAKAASMSYLQWYLQTASGQVPDYLKWNTF
eukprot:6074844-Amphidinium_carterae.1